jgi:hypothetical protein
VNCETERNFRECRQAPRIFVTTACEIRGAVADRSKKSGEKSSNNRETSLVQHHLVAKRNPEQCGLLLTRKLLTTILKRPDVVLPITDCLSDHSYAQFLTILKMDMDNELRHFLVY